MTGMQEAREFDLSDRIEGAIYDLVADEGLVLWSRRSGGFDGTQTHLLAVVAGEDGPQIVFASGWMTSSGPQVRERLRLPVETACRRHLPASLGESLVAHLPDDAAVVNASGGGARPLSRDSDGRMTVYLLRLPMAGGGKELAITTSERLEDGSWLASLQWSYPSETFQEWAEVEIGGPIPTPR